MDKTELNAMTEAQLVDKIAILAAKIAKIDTYTYSAMSVKTCKGICKTLTAKANETRKELVPLQDRLVYLIEEKVAATEVARLSQLVLDGEDLVRELCDGARVIRMFGVGDDDDS